jgi:DNA-binding NtrC family response regulator
LKRQRGRSPRPSEAPRLEDAERPTIADAIRRSGGDLSKAAQTLGIARTRFYHKAERYGIRRGTD